MADDPIQSVSSDDLVRAARESVGTDESLSEQMLREARQRVEAGMASSAQMPDLAYPGVETDDLPPPAEVEPPPRSTTPRTPVPSPSARRPRRTGSRRKSPTRQTTATPGPVLGTTRPRIPRAARGLIPLIIFGVIFLSNIFGNEGDSPEAVPVDVSATTQEPQAGVEVRTDAPSINLALQRPAEASGQTSDGAAALAVDGDPSTAWNSGGFPAQWIDIDLGAPATVRQVRLRVAQSPPIGNTVHVVLGRGPGTGGEEVLLGVFERQTVDNTWIAVKPAEPPAGIDHVRVFTEDSPSLVAWFEIEVLGVPE